MDKVPFILGGDKKDTPEILNVISPVNSEIVERVSLATREDIDEAIERAKSAFKVIKSMSSCERADILLRVSELIKDRKDELAKLITKETAKPLKYSRGEVERAISVFKLAGEEAKRIEGELLPLDISVSLRDRFGIVRYFPIGIVLGITPFNFPLNLVAHKLAPAIASGNCIIIKPAPQTPVTAIRLGEIVYEAGLPKGGLSVLPTTNELAQVIVEDERIAMLSFTGSADVGWRLKSLAGKKKVLLELGGNAGVIVDRTADIEKAVERIVYGGFAFSGQVCISVQRVYIDKELEPYFVRLLLDRVEKLKLGDPYSEDTDIGPMISEREAERVMEWIEEAKRNGAEVLCGGKREGSVLYPTVLRNVERKMRVCAKEVFAPVIVLDTFTDFEDAIDKVNDTRYGLQAGIFTRDIGRVLKAFEELEVGGVIVNDVPTFRVDSMPYGGVKDSGFGREGIKYAIREMMERKLLVL